MVLNTSCYYVRNLSYTTTFTFQGRDGPQGAKHSNCSDSRQVSDIWCHGDIPEEIKVSPVWCFLNIYGTKISSTKVSFFRRDNLKMQRQFHLSKSIFLIFS